MRPLTTETTLSVQTPTPLTPRTPQHQMQQAPTAGTTPTPRRRLAPGTAPPGDQVTPPWAIRATPTKTPLQHPPVPRWHQPGAPARIGDHHRADPATHSKRTTTRTPMWRPPQGPSQDSNPTTWLPNQSVPAAHSQRRPRPDPQQPTAAARRGSQNKWTRRSTSKSKGRSTEGSVLPSRPNCRLRRQRLQPIPPFKAKMTHTPRQRPPRDRLATAPPAPHHHARLYRVSTALTHHKRTTQRSAPPSTCRSPSTSGTERAP